MSILRSFFIATAALAIGACASQTEVIKLYEEAGRGDRHFERVFVVSVIGDTGSRRRLEELITGHLEDANVAAVAGYTETGLKPSLLQDEINAAARKVGADAILVTHIVSTDTSIGRDSGAEAAACSGGDTSDAYYMYEREELQESDSVKMAHTVVAVSNLYDAASGERLWTIQSTCFEKATMDEVLREEARAIVRQLTLDELVG